MIDTAMKTPEQVLTASYDAAQNAFLRGDYEAAARLASDCADAFERMDDLDRAADMNACYAAATAAADAIATWNQRI
ncbi:hypothetical protein [Isoptericola dokdonensis]|uniref:Uncharacterized protein n=1 Tax=Isoptericola dokdonensis DS-3 TaxID=1300344 RepID=A0A161IHZ9_9MICO|nr:hypothetical protein [Isoptericola dokdonensis]ANC31414.1 hypothetical protein I598_1866 [Isoptericola dokdonensis DS-3]